MLWDGPEDGIATYNYQEEEDWSKTVAQCCLLDTIPQVLIKEVVQCCVLKPIPQVLIKTSGSMLCTKAYSSGINKNKWFNVVY
jgi:hypothetical protein